MTSKTDEYHAKGRECEELAETRDPFLKQQMSLRARECSCVERSVATVFNFPFGAFEAQCQNRGDAVMPNRRQVATRAIVAAGVYLHPNYYVGDQRQETRGNPVGFTNRRHGRRLS